MDDGAMDKELQAMVDLSKAMALFGDEDGPAVQRVLTWFNSKFGYAGAKGVRTGAAAPAGAGPSEVGGAGRTFATAADLYDAVAPELEYEKALTIGYWFQVCNGQETFTGQDVNGTLKHMGHGIGNITDAFNSVKDRKPALVMQTQKSGTSKQARKMYKLTTAGIRWVENRLQGGSAAESTAKEGD